MSDFLAETFDSRALCEAVRSRSLVERGRTLARRGNGGRVGRLGSSASEVESMDGRLTSRVVGPTEFGPLL